MTDLTFNDITWSYTLNKVLKNSDTGMISEIKYTYTGTYTTYSSSIANNVIQLAASDPTAADFINIADLTTDDCSAWIDAQNSVGVIFDIELARAPGIVPWLDVDDPKQPYNQDLTNFRHSNYKEQMQENIRKTIQKKVTDAALNVPVQEEHTF